jgi:hypothetical protein
VTKDSITNWVMLVVVALWGASVVLEMFDRSYHVPGTVQLIMAATATYLFGKSALAKVTRDVEAEEKKKEEGP